MTNVNAISFGSDHKSKKPTILGTVGYGLLGATAGTGVYCAKNYKAIADCVDFSQFKKDSLTVKEIVEALKSNNELKIHTNKCLKFLGIGTAISAGTYLAVKIISAHKKHD